ncbi:MAG: DUF402 domain-containing protein [Alicyclobacillus sp.]|nr:DUF402 domain-containing protein [Alicyclobacillus sp.]
MTDPVQMVSYRPQGQAHRRWLEAWPTPEPWVFAVPAGSPVEEADGRRWSSPYPVVALFWPHRFAQVFLLLKPSGAEYYCNACSPPAYHPEKRRLAFVDLDLDLYVDAAGVRWLDEEEFAARQSAYPAGWAAAAQSALTQLARLAAQRQGPFAPATAAAWRRWCARRWPFAAKPGDRPAP